MTQTDTLTGFLSAQVQMSSTVFISLAYVHTHTHTPAWCAHSDLTELMLVALLNRRAERTQDEGHRGNYLVS